MKLYQVIETGQLLVEDFIGLIGNHITYNYPATDRMSNVYKSNLTADDWYNVTPSPILISIYVFKTSEKVSNH